MFDDDEDDDAGDGCSFSCTALCGRMGTIGAIRAAAASLLGLLMSCGIAFVFSADCDITGFTTIDFLFVSPPLSNGDDAAGAASFLRISSNVFVVVVVVGVVVMLGMLATTGTALEAEEEAVVGCTSFTNGPGANVVCAPFLLFRLSEL